MYTIAIDLGGTVVKIGLLSDGEIVDCVRLPSRLALGLAPNLPKIKEAIDRLLAAWRIDVAALRCIGLAFPGLVDPIHNRVISTNEKYDDACSISLDKWAWENWEVPFCMDNDARLAVAGEWWQGAARGKEQCSHDDNRNRYRYGSRDRWTASVWTAFSSGFFGWAFCAGL